MIGTMMILAFIAATIEMVRYSHVYAWFVLPALCYAIASCYYVRYLLQDTEQTRRDFFVFYIVFVAFIFRLYEYVLYKHQPEYVEEVCDLTNDRQSCEAWFDSYFIYLWLFSIVINFYFAYILMEFKNQLILDFHTEHMDLRTGWRAIEKPDKHTGNSLYLPVSNLDLD